MSEQSKEWIGAALLGDLLVELGRREKIRRLLGELGQGASPELVKILAQEFEEVLESLRQKQLEKALRNAEVKSPAGSSFEIHLKAPESVLRAPTVQPSVLEKESPPEPVLPAKPAPSVLAEKTPPVPQIPVEEPAPPPPPPPPAPPPLTRVFHPEPPREEETAPMAASRASTRTPYEQKLDESLYVHAVTFVPTDEEPSPYPFMLEAKGIDGKSFVFGFDHGRFRFYLSKLAQESMSISKAGMLLLSKADSLRLRGVHESTLNDLRTQGVLLPFEFGTVVFSKQDLVEKTGANIGELEQALDELVRTVWWNLQVFAMDSRMAQLVAPENPVVRREQERGRTSFSAPVQQKRIDIKTLERILNKQRKIAESVHQRLSAVASRSDVDMMIDLGGGSSEDWKSILRASYEVPDSRLSAFNREVAQLQYENFLFELMLAVRGDREEFQFH